ncbi:hypothetical protein PM082_021741 [Marasmius tenuissimus]|nr:hypothetical protein PM082_021741 [Marasmius tenuissimus]
MCAQWRKIVHGCPRLWSSINIELNAPSNPVLPLEIYLRRSKTHSLSLLLSFRLPVTRDQPQGGLSRDKNPHFRRCRDLVPDMDDLSMLPAIENLEFPNLVTYSHPSYGFHTLIDGDRRGFWDAMHVAPKLTNVDMLDFLPLSWLSYQQLTTISTSDLFIEEHACYILPHCTALVFLSLNSNEAEAQERNAIPSIPQQRIEVPSLCYLSLWGNSGRIDSNDPLASLYLPVMDLPALTNFIIRAWPSPCAAFLEQCSTTLQILTVSLLGLWTSDDSPSIDLLLTTLPILTNLTRLEFAITRRKDGHPALTRSIHTLQDVFLEFETQIVGFRTRTSYIPTETPVSPSDSFRRRMDQR